MELKFASTFVSLSLDQILAPSTVFLIDLTQITNKTALLNANDLSTFSTIWSYALNVTSDELFTNESQYKFFYRIQTNISIIIDRNIFYVSNLREPIAWQVEVIFHNLLFTVVVLDVFALLFLIIKFLFVSVFRGMLICLRFHRLTRIQVNPIDDLTMVVAKNNDPSSVDKQIWPQLPRSLD